MMPDDKEKMETIRKREPFNFGIKELKRVLDRMDMPKGERNKTIKLYKDRLYTRIDEVKAKMEAVNPKGTNLADMIEYEDKEDATDK